MVYISRLFKAKLENVWEAWTEPEHVKEWLAPKNYTAPVVKMDLQVGGSYLNSMRSDDGNEVWSTGVYREVVPLEKLVSTDSFADNEGNVVPASHYGMTEDWPMELTITVTFKEEDGATRVTIEHQGFPDHNNSSMAETGWQESLDKLEAHLKNIN
ncbi:MAG: SRPBCC domain-containing protein [Methanobacterium sp.]|nr:SRPBCC domain-containing protein [Methanobacterium sp.]